MDLGDDAETIPTSNRDLTMAATLAERLQIWREAKGLSLRALEEKAGISNAYLSQIETGKVKEPSLTNLKKIAAAYGVSVSTLIGETL